MPPLPTATLDDLYAFFPSTTDKPTTELIPAEQLPPCYRALLDHRHHMTVTVEQFYGDSVKVQVLDSVHHESIYARKILLALSQSGMVVQFGIVQIDLKRLHPEVQAKILEGRTPLGRVLIQHNVLRTVEPTGFFRVTLSEPMASWLQSSVGSITFGRIGLITADGLPAIRVVEILAPIPDAQEKKQTVPSK